MMMEMKVGQHKETKRANMKDILKDTRELNCISNYTFHDQDSF